MASSPNGASITITPAQRRLLLIAASLGTFAAMLPSFSITVTLPTIADAFDVGVPTTQWVMTALFVTQAATMLPVGSAGDIFGRLRVYAAGFFVLLVGLILTPFAFSMDALIILRGVQGVGSGMILVTAPAIVTAALPESERGRAIAIVFLGGYLANLIGQPLAGALATYTTWYAPFLIAIVPAVLGLSLSLRLRDLVPRRSDRSFDFVGSALMVVAFGALVVAIGHGQQEHWEAAHTVVHVGPLFLASALAAVLYLVYARLVPNPILPLQLFHSLTMTTVSITNTLLHMTMLMISFLMPFYLQNVLGYSPLSMAFMLVPMSITLNLMALPSGWLYDRIGSRIPCAVAMALGVVVLLSYRQLNEASSFVDVLPRLLISGLVLGLFVTPNVAAMFGAVPEKHYSLVSGLEKTTQNLGHALGVVLSSAVATFYLGGIETGASAATYVSVVHGASLVAGLLMGMGAVLALMRREPRKEWQKRQKLPVPIPTSPTG